MRRLLSHRVHPSHPLVRRCARGQPLRTTGSGPAKPLRSPWRRWLGRGAAVWLGTSAAVSAFHYATAEDVAHGVACTGEHANPFVYDTFPTPMENVKMALNGVWMFPLRTIVWATALGTAVALFRLGLAGQDVISSDMSWWRHAAVRASQAVARVSLVAQGVNRIHVEGARAPLEEAPVVVVNHVSSADPVIMFTQFIPCGVCKAEVEHLPLIGPVANKLNWVMVDRFNVNSRRNALADVMERTNAIQRGDFSIPMMMFAEGTTSNGHALLHFKGGAFAPKVPVQPVTIQYTYRHFNPANTLRGGGIWSFIRSMCQWNTSVKVTFHPVYHPSEEEQNDVTLYARNVQQYMANALNVPATEWALEDCYLSDNAPDMLMMNIPIRELRDIHPMTRDEATHLVQWYGERAKQDPSSSLPSNASVALQRFDRRFTLQQQDWMSHWAPLCGDDVALASWRAIASNGCEIGTQGCEADCGEDVTQMDFRTFAIGVQRLRAQQTQPKHQQQRDGINNVVTKLLTTTTTKDSSE